MCHFGGFLKSDDFEGMRIQPGASTYTLPFFYIVLVVFVVLLQVKDIKNVIGSKLRKKNNDC